MPDRPPSIFVAHRDRDSLNVLQACLEDIDYHVAFATCAGHELLARIRQEPPDIVLVGAGLKDMDTINLLNEVSLQSDCCAIALLPPEMVDRAESELVDRIMGVLIDPPDNHQLRSALHVALTRHREATALNRQIHRLEDDLYRESPADPDTP